LPDKAVQESRERVKAALKACGYAAQRPALQGSDWQQLKAKICANSCHLQLVAVHRRP